MNPSEQTLDIRAEPDGKKHKVTVLLDGAVLFVDTLNLSHAPARERFTDALAGKFGGVERDAVNERLMEIAACESPGGPTSAAEPLEIDVRSVVRPELFHSAAVSGVTVPLILDAGGKVVARWQTFLRWSDGRREVVAVPDRLALPDASVLYVAPDPGDPGTTDSPAWSAASRRSWLAGEPAPDPGRVFQTVRDLIARYLDFAPDAAPGTTATLTLWTMLTYAYPAWDAVPYLFVGGPMGSGKSRLLDVLQRLVFRPFFSSNVTAPTVFRTLHAHGGTMIFDEAERLKQTTPDQQEVLSVFLSGYQRGGCATRLEPLPDGGFRPVKFDVFGPKVVACIAGLPPTMASRCIPVTMFRNAADSEKTRRRPDAEAGTWRSARDDLHVLALEHGPAWVEMAARGDVVPPGIGGRNYELWQPLMAMAAWLEGYGCDGLLKLVQRQAVATVTSAKEDGIPEADEVLLELLTERVLAHNPPTTAELLTAARQRDEVTFKNIYPKSVATRLKNYGIKLSQKTNGERRYREVTLEQLAQIQQRYGVDLGLG